MNRKCWYIIIFMLIATKLFGVELPGIPLINLCCVIIFYISFLSSYKKLKNNSFGKFLCAFMVFFLISCLYSIVFNDQKIVSMFSGTIDYIGFLIIPLCMKLNLSKRDISRILLLFSIIFCSCYIIQWIIFPTIIFQGAAERIETVDFRMRLPCSICAFYLFMIGVKSLMDKDKKKGLIYILMGGFPIIIMGFRTLTTLTLLFSIIMYLTTIKLNVKGIISTIIIGVSSLVIYSTPIVQNKIEEMNARNESGDTFANTDYVRYVEWDFYRNYFDKPGEWLLGAGVPCGTGKYTQGLMKVNEQFLWWQDLGLIGLSFILGIITVLIIIIFTLYNIKMCKCKEMIHVRYTIIIVLLGSLLTTMEYYRSGNFMIMGLLFYYVYINKEEYKKTILKIR